MKLTARNNIYYKSMVSNHKTPQTCNYFRMDSTAKRQYKTKIIIFKIVDFIRSKILFGWNKLKIYTVQATAFLLNLIKLRLNSTTKEERLKFCNVIAFGKIRS